MLIKFNELYRTMQRLKKNEETLLSAEECLRNERTRLSENSELAHVLQKMMQTVSRLEEKAETEKKLRLALQRIIELYSKGEERISDRIDCGKVSVKTSLVPCGKLNERISPTWRIQ